MILSKTQAEAIYSAASQINNLGGRMNMMLNTKSDRPISIAAGGDGGGIAVVAGFSPWQIESYLTNADFAAAYGLE
ncbi:hypothetical protein [Rhodoferax mekongensis]|uniref:Uncharacterized protein n=1 Tax=Rhodoferax mekongensis TaxID=3068341 RepID=A0ABZ0B3S4_9BURK|nr:hypothetical protein [Rhodoferax sp. TBRC 17307]WNO06016.1 hypothetical protein RAN89_06190 [Rhodoferax sp. TBRC 17307]